MARSGFKMKGSAFYGRGNASPLHKESAWSEVGRGFKQMGSDIAYPWKKGYKYLKSKLTKSKSKSKVTHAIPGRKV